MTSNAIVYIISCNFHVSYAQHKQAILCHFSIKVQDIARVFTTQKQILRPTAMAMFQQIMFLLTLLQLCLIPQSICGHQQQILCVQASGSSTSSSECKTLMDWYSNNSTAAFTSNTELLFQEGFHSLHEFINISNCHNFTMAGHGSAQHNINGLPQLTSIISCKGASDSDTGLSISNSSNISIHNLEFRFCTGKYTLEKNYHYSGSLILHFGYNITLHQVVVNKTIGYGLHVINIHGEIKVQDSAFLYTSPHHSKLNSSGNANFFFDEEITTSLVLNTCWFMYERDYRAASGIKIFICHANVQVTLLNVTAQGNTGNYGGNLAIFVTETEVAQLLSIKVIY